MRMPLGRVATVLDDTSCLVHTSDFESSSALSVAGTGVPGVSMMIDIIGVQGVVSQLHASGCSNVVFVTPAR